MKKELGKMKVKELKELSDYMGVNFKEGEKNPKIRKGELVKYLTTCDIKEEDLNKFYEWKNTGKDKRNSTVDKKQLLIHYMQAEKGMNYLIEDGNKKDLIVTRDLVYSQIKDKLLGDYYYEILKKIGSLLNKGIIRKRNNYSNGKLENIEYLYFNKKEIFSVFSHVFDNILLEPKLRDYDFSSTKREYESTSKLLDTLISKDSLAIEDCKVSNQAGKLLYNSIVLIYKIDQSNEKNIPIDYVHEYLWNLSDNYLKNSDDDFCLAVYNSLQLLEIYMSETLAEKEIEKNRLKMEKIFSKYYSCEKYDWLKIVSHYVRNVAGKYYNIHYANRMLVRYYNYEKEDKRNLFKEIFKVKIINAPNLEKVYGYSNGYRVFSDAKILEEYKNFVDLNIFEYNSQEKIEENLNIRLDKSECLDFKSDKKCEFENRLLKIQKDVSNTKTEISSIDETIKNLRTNILNAFKPLDEKIDNVSNEVNEHLKQQKSYFLEQLDTNISKVNTNIEIITKKVKSLENNYAADKVFYQEEITKFSKRLNDIEENYKEADDKVKKVILQQILPELNRILPLADEHLATENKQKSIMEVDGKEFTTRNYEQKIFSGVPGCGKSYAVNKIIEGGENYRVTFFPEYENHNFVGTIKPKVKNGMPIYEFVPGPFTKALKYAYHHPSDKVNLVIEEMTRGNASAIFGEVFQLLDRDENGWSEYPVENENIFNEIGVEVNGKLTLNSISLPPNFAIYGTLNTSDQNVFALDSAFKRRFKDEYISIKDVTLERDFNLIYCNKTIKWSEFYKTINEYIIDNVGMSEDKQVGPYRIKKADDIDSVLRYLYTDIDCISYSGKRLFNDTVKSQEGLGAKFATKKIFNEELNKKLVGEQ